MTLKIAVLAPIPSAMVSTAVSVNTGLRRNVRTANDRSCSGMAHPTMTSCVREGTRDTHALRQRRRIGRLTDSDDAAQSWAGHSDRIVNACLWRTEQALDTRRKIRR